MAFFPAATSCPSLLGEMYSSAFALSAFNWDCGPAVTELEVIVMCWLGKMLNLPSSYTSGEGGRMIQGSVSEAILNVMVAARERYLFQTTAHLEGFAREDLHSQKRSRLVVLGSDECHSSTAKAAIILGMKYRAVSFSIDDAFSMVNPRLSIQVAVYLELRADSFLDSNLFVQEQITLSHALSIDAPHLRSKASSSLQVIEFRNLQASLPRRFLALKIWFVMRTYGVSGFKPTSGVIIVLETLSTLSSLPDSTFSTSWFLRPSH